MARVSDAASARFDWPDVSEELPAAELIPSAALTRQLQASEQAGHPSAPRARTDGSSLFGVDTVVRVRRVKRKRK